MTITLKISDNTKQKMIEYFQDKKREKTPPYAVFQADEADTVVTLYESGKVVFQGISADIDASLWKQMEQNLNPGKKVEETNSDEKKEKDKKDDFEEKKLVEKIYLSRTIGSDEVGTGDYFGPIVVTAAYVTKEDIPYLEKLGVRDSKKLSDEKILEIVPEIIKKISYTSIILNNKEYNEKYSESINMNKMKAIMHNRVLYLQLAKMKKENKPVDAVVVDQFAKPFVYYNYLKELDQVVRKITFFTKAEDKILSVACGSLISRYIFLKEFKKLEKTIGMDLPKGASNLVDQKALEIVKKYGFDKLKEVAKLNFKNTDKVKVLYESSNM
ncbi:MAG: ribonuclease HIII [Firmicutes bacterium]|nr:ribonuclease HIII [Bacillota bacterium]